MGLPVSPLRTIELPSSSIILTNNIYNSLNNHPARAANNTPIHQGRLNHTHNTHTHTPRYNHTRRTYVKQQTTPTNTTNNGIQHNKQRHPTATKPLQTTAPQTSNKHHTTANNQQQKSTNTPHNRQRTTHTKQRTATRNTHHNTPKRQTTNKAILGFQLRTTNST